MQELIVALCVLAAAVYIFRRIWRNLHRREPLSCGCSGCDAIDTCPSASDAPGSAKSCRPGSPPSVPRR